MTQQQYLQNGGWKTSHIPHHEQPWVKESMKSFHSKLCKWEQRLCSVCHEAWPTQNCLNNHYHYIPTYDNCARHLRIYVYLVKLIIIYTSQGVWTVSQVDSTLPRWHFSCESTLRPAPSQSRPHRRQPQG